MAWTLADIRTKVRQVTGRYSVFELSNDQLDNYINNYFQFTFPAELKLERFHSIYELETLSNQATYPYPAGFINFEPPALIDRAELIWYQDPISFAEQNPYTINKVTIGIGDGATLGFSGGSQFTPVLAGSIYVSDGVEVFTNTSTTWTTSNITLTGSLGGTGTANLSDGTVSVTFNTAPADGVNVVFSYINFVAGRPTAVLLYNNQFEFYPVPDQTYQFETKAYSDTLVITASGTTQTLFVNGTDAPLYQQWGPCIAYGAARDIHSDYGEMDAYAEVTTLYREQQAYALRRTNQNLLNERAAPHF